jgi:predicted molibdopterin-dependent oxidoreductase YjgC
MPVSGTVTAQVANILTGNFAQTATGNPYSLNTNATLGYISEAPLHQLWRVANDAQACYAQAIRSKLSFT